MVLQCYILLMSLHKSAGGLNKVSNLTRAQKAVLKAVPTYWSECKGYCPRTLDALLVKGKVERLKDSSGKVKWRLA